MQNFNTAELRPVERARAYLLKKMPLTSQIGAREHVLESVHEREFAKSLFSSQSFVWRTSEVHRQHAPQTPQRGRTRSWG